MSCLNWKYHFAENEVQAAGRAGAEGESAADPIKRKAEKEVNLLFFMFLV